MAREKVCLRAVPDYDPSLIKKVVQESLDEYGLTGSPYSDVTIKPNVVMAHHRIAPQKSRLRKNPALQRMSAQTQGSYPVDFVQNRHDQPAVSSRPDHRCLPLPFP